jgi:hypothetical protein
VCVVCSPKRLDSQAGSSGGSVHHDPKLASGLTVLSGALSISFRENRKARIPIHLPVYIYHRRETLPSKRSPCVSTPRKPAAGAEPVVYSYALVKETQFSLAWSVVLVAISGIFSLSVPANTRTVRPTPRNEHLHAVLADFCRHDSFDRRMRERDMSRDRRAEHFIWTRCLSNVVLCVDFLCLSYSPIIQKDDRCHVGQRGADLTVQWKATL